MNLNKLVPRLTIRAKLAVAFGLLAIVPLAFVAIATTIGSVRQLRRQDARAADYDLQAAHLDVTREIHQSEQHLSFLIEAALTEIAQAADADELARAARVTSTFLRADPSALFRIKVLDPEGRVVFLADRDTSFAPAPGEGAEELLYVWALDGVAPGGRAILPVEFRLGPPGGGSDDLVAAVAIVQALRSEEGEEVGIAVAEAKAAILFAGLERSSPGFEGTNGLVDHEGRFLYHSDRKRDWTSLLASGETVSLADEFVAEDAARILSGATDTFTTADGRFVSYRPIRFGRAGSAPLILFRSIPRSLLAASVQHFLLLTVVVGSVIVLVVAATAYLAAEQFTRPIVALQRAVRGLAEGGEPVAPLIETNDELEDLAKDFAKMAEILADQRHRLEDTVESRTRALERTQAQLAQVVAHAVDAIVGLDSERVVRLWNEGAERLFDFSECEAVGARLDDLIGLEGEEYELEVEFIRRSYEVTDGVVGLRTKRRQKGGEVIPVSLTESAIRDGEGRVVGASLIVRDERLQSELEAQMRRSERLAAISIMAAGLAHEFNNPLAVVGNRIELMERDSGGPVDRERMMKDLAVLKEHIGRIRDVTTDLLNFAREDDQGRSLVDLSQVVRRVVRLLEHTYATRGVRLEIVEANGGCSVYGTEKTIETVVTNLLINAAQATRAGGWVRVDVRGSRAGDFVEIRVSDSGPGVPPDLRSRIFDPFFTTKADSGGTGLGLTVCRAVMEQHGGALSLFSPREGGSRFVASFPRAGLGGLT